MNSEVPRRPMGHSARWAHRLRVVQAMVLLTLGGAAQRWVPMPRWSRVLGRHGEVPAAWRGQRIEALPSRSADDTERQVARAVRSGARRLPWKPSCLAEATAAQVMLRRRGSSGVVVVGLFPGDGGSWAAHAWLLGRHGALTGGAAAAGFTATTVYEVPHGLTADEVALAPAPPRRT